MKILMSESIIHVLHGNELNFAGGTKFIRSPVSGENLWSRLNV